MQSVIFRHGDQKIIEDPTQNPRYSSGGTPETPPQHSDDWPENKLSREIRAKRRKAHRRILSEDRFKAPVGSPTELREAGWSVRKR